MLPSVIPEALIAAFKYWQEGVKVGMFYNNELFTQVKTYNLADRLAAYEDACELSDQGIQVCVTVSDREYCLWQSLKSDSPSLVTSEPVLAVCQS